MCCWEENSVSVEETLRSNKTEKREIGNVRDRHSFHKYKNVGLSERSTFLDVCIRGE